MDRTASYQSARPLLALFAAFGAGLTRPGFLSALVVFAGWIATAGRHAVTQALVATDVARRRHHEAFHRFFSRGTWDPDNLCRILFDTLVKSWLPCGPICAAIDDTLAPKKGPKIFGIGTHLDAVTSTKKHKNFRFGHVWVVLSIIVKFPCFNRPWAIPVLFRLYRSTKDCRKANDEHIKKTELAREMLEVLSKWTCNREVIVLADEGYGNHTVVHALPQNVTVVASMRADAVLTEKAPSRSGTPRGRPRLRGERLPSPAALANDGTRPWSKCHVFTYGSKRVIHYKTLLAQWYTVTGARLLRVVVVRTDEGNKKFRVFFSTDLNLSVVSIIERYSWRWSIEVCFRDLKQELGFAESQARTKNAVNRTAPFVGLIYGTLVLWFAGGAHATPLAAPPIRPWYSHKKSFSFADIVRAAQRALASIDILDPGPFDADHAEIPRSTTRALPIIEPAPA